jgi:hypothetical protein
MLHNFLLQEDASWPGAGGHTLVFLTLFVWEMLIELRFGNPFYFCGDAGFNPPKLLVALLHPQGVEGHVENNAKLNETPDEADLSVVDLD